MAVTPAIPATQLVNVIPSVLSAGGSALDLIGLILTQNIRPPIGQVLSFPNDGESVADYFGPMSQEAALASIYFLGFNNSTAKPGLILFAQYPEAAVAAYLRGGNVSALSLTQLQAINGTLSITIDAVVKTGTVNLSGATSFSNAAQIIGDTLDIEGADVAHVTGAISTTTLTVSAVTDGVLAVGSILSGSGVTAGTYITALGSGTGGTGTYTVTPSQTASSTAILAETPAVTFDSVSGGFLIKSDTTGASSTIAYATGTAADDLKLRAADGAVISQGAAAATPAAFMASIIDITQDWVSFMTTWEGSDSEKEAFAAWTNSTVNRYLYAEWDTDIANTENGGPAPAWAAILAAEYSGVSLNYSNPNVDTVGGEIAAFVMGTIASIDFTRRNGRITLAYKAQSGFPAQVFTASQAAEIIGYGGNLYGDYTTANEAFTLYQPGAVTGPFKWTDSYVNQIWLNNQLQLAILNGLANVNSVPYNRAGYTMIEAFCLDPINEAANAGVIVAGVQLSQAQAAAVNSAAGLKIDDILTQRGWYLQVLDAIAQVRAARGSPPCTLWYCDGGSIQKISLASIEVQ